MHAYPPRYTLHAHHAHTNMHAKVYTYTHCGRESYLIKFYFDKLNLFNFANKNVGVPNATNSRGTKKIRVPKSTQIVFDVGVVSHNK